MGRVEMANIFLSRRLGGSRGRQSIGHRGQLPPCNSAGAAHVPESDANFVRFTGEGRRFSSWTRDFAKNGA